MEGDARRSGAVATLSHVRQHRRGRSRRRLHQRARPTPTRARGGAAPTGGGTTMTALAPVTDLRPAPWTAVCHLDDLDVGRGVAAMMGGRQVALFRLPGDDVRAIDNRDPFSGANVLARGIVGSRGSVPKVASPMYKQTFDLRTGRCFEDPSVAVATYPVHVDHRGRVLVSVP